MPRAVALPIREELVRRHQQGESLAALSRSMQLPYRTVLRLWQRFRTQGRAGLAPAYDHGRPPEHRFPAAVVEAAVTLKREHPSWGAGLIRLQLAEQFPEQPLPQVRTCQDWFRQAGVHTPRTRRPSAPAERARTPHGVWQLDGKEGIRLQDGTAPVALNLVDEASGATLAAAVFPPGEGGADPGTAGPRLAPASVRPLGSAGTAPGG